MLNVNSKKHDFSRRIIRDFLKRYQDYLTLQLEGLDGSAKFIEDSWQKNSLGSGRTRVISNGDYFEQGGVNFSEIEGKEVPKSLLGQMPELNGYDYWGAGVSLVLHPKNPFCPTTHLNYRYFEAGPFWWFGGGSDLTPYYPFKEDCCHWHKTLKKAMDEHDTNYYRAFKYWCDEYFYNHHRRETRGVGGTFYDYLSGIEGRLVKNDYARKSEKKNHPALHLNQRAKSWIEIFAFQKDNAEAFIGAYFPIANKRRSMKWNEKNRQFQLYRRGRYVEFNLLHDRGTLFGLQTNGRIESILMSMPPLARWEYNYSPRKGSDEYKLSKIYLHRDIDWIKYK
ncbi:MAG TPA: oxygen-dependent coproporphyrinogen oxidase [Gammaproteobacteria bacterium]|nr:oxygen-dependent coproporphyrinogen oxidase [Gammaproteobacteria bacterium]